MPRACLTAIVLGILCTSLQAQRYALPQEMVRQFRMHRIWALRFWLAADADNNVQAQVVFRNGESNRVKLGWTCRVGNSQTTYVDEEVDLSFTPTAVCFRTGIGDTIYVTGWSTRTGQVIVEEWKFVDYQWRERQPPGFARSTTEFTPGAIERSIIWVSERESLSPIWGMACFPGADELWLLTSGTGILVLDLDKGELATRIDPGTPGLEIVARCQSMAAGQDPSGGLMIIAEPHKPWGDARGERDPYLIFLARDANGDGVMDEAGAKEYSAIYDEFGGWTTRF